MFEAIREIISDTLKIEPQLITADSTMEEMGVDSLGLVELSMELEKCYCLQLGDEALQGLETVSDIIKLIEQRTMAT
jgi:acyl carrier protein